VSTLKILHQLYKNKHEHFIFVDLKLYCKWKYLIKFIIFLNPNYISCTIFRKKYKIYKNIVIIGLKWNGKNVKRRTTGFAKEFLEESKNPKCIFCRQSLTETNITVDHIIPISKGGNNCQVNLITCCLDCNNERGNSDFYTYLRLKNGTYKNKKYIFI
jgi:5-methylcytosine-specific restriction endonuclease McrA